MHAHKQRSPETNLSKKHKQRSPETNLEASESGGHLLSHDATQYHRRYCVSAVSLSAALASVRSLFRLCPLCSLSRAPQARTPPPAPRL